ncbi:MAG: PepSY domain-containing protein [Candidatus Accumulibacter sp.]|nr:PepSY domain-containing protein [Accumulibacter sp.]
MIFVKKALRAAVARRLPIVLFAVTLSAAVGASLAGDDHDGDHDRARRALEAGEVLPLRVILERIERAWPGQIVEVELERHDGRWKYEIKLLRAGGALVKLKVDARDGSVLGVKGRKDAGQEERHGDDEHAGEKRGEQR